LKDLKSGHAEFSSSPADSLTLAQVDPTSPPMQKVEGVSPEVGGSQGVENTEKSSPNTEVIGEIEVRGIPEVLVKARRSLNADIERTRDDVRPYVVLDRETIEKSGATSVNELLRDRVTMNYVQKPN